MLSGGGTTVVMTLCGGGTVSTVSTGFVYRDDRWRCRFQRLLDEFPICNFAVRDRLFSPLNRMLRGMGRKA